MKLFPISVLGSCALVAAQKTVTVQITETPPPSISTVFITSTETPNPTGPVTAPYSETTYKVGTYSGQAQYVTVFDESSDESINDIFGVSIIGSQGESTTYEIVPTIRVEHHEGGDVSTDSYNKRTVTVAPTTYKMIESESSNSASSALGVSAQFQSLSVWCSIGGTTTAVCTGRFFGSADSPVGTTEMTITKTSLVFQTYEVVEQVATGSDSIISVRPTDTRPSSMTHLSSTPTPSLSAGGTASRVTSSGATSVRATNGGQGSTTSSTSGVGELKADANLKRAVGLIMTVAVILQCY